MSMSPLVCVDGFVPENLERRMLDSRCQLLDVRPCLLSGNGAAAHARLQSGSIQHRMQFYTKRRLQAQ
jgi:hypothetical protein